MSNVDLMAGAGPVHDYRDNPFGLVYEYPITANVPGQVNIHPVSYLLRGLTITANVYTPPGYDPAGSYPAITVAHPNGGTEEQTAGRYAQRLAEQGYVTIAADAAYQGHSGGEPRSTDKPFFRTDDIHGMADFLATYPGVDATRIGALGARHPLRQPHPRHPRPRHLDEVMARRRRHRLHARTRQRTRRNPARRVRPTGAHVHATLPLT